MQDDTIEHGPTASCCRSRRAASAAVRIAGRALQTAGPALGLDNWDRGEARAVVLYLLDLKVVRLAHDPKHLDSIVDVAGHAACLQEVSR
jgi:Domain of unknown function (DUF6378)